ncbi:MAG TPA: prephenate dehydratase [Firmicutes bacterium]|nr:prephenate dehydratase [Bacillota bacterium]
MSKILGYLGPRGTFTEEVSIKYAKDKDLLLKPFPALDKVFNAVARKEIEYGIVPVENSLEGSVNFTHDLLSNSDVKIQGELLLRVRQLLLARPGQKPSQIKEIYSHPQALAQCRLFLDKNYPGRPRINIASTAEAAALVAQNYGKAAIASIRAAELYGLEILQDSIQNEPSNITRFLLIGLDDVPPTGNDKTSLLVGLHDKPGTLYSILGVFARYSLNLTKIESRPIRGELGKYIFFLDFEGHREEKIVAQAMQEAEKQVLFLKVLGSYPRAESDL